MPLIPPPHSEGYASYLAAMEEPSPLANFAALKSLDDLDEEDEDEDDDDDLDDVDEDEDEDDDDLEDVDEDEDDLDEDEDEDEEDEDGGVKPLKMAPLSLK